MTLYSALYPRYSVLSTLYPVCTPLYLLLTSLHSVHLPSYLVLRSILAVQLSLYSVASLPCSVLCPWSVCTWFVVSLASGSVRTYCYLVLSDSVLSFPFFFGSWTKKASMGLWRCRWWDRWFNPACLCVWNTTNNFWVLNNYNSCFKPCSFGKHPEESHHFYCLFPGFPQPFSCREKFYCHESRCS